MFGDLPLEERTRLLNAAPPARFDHVLFSYDSKSIGLAKGAQPDINNRDWHKSFVKEREADGFIVHVDSPKHYRLVRGDAAATQMLAEAGVVFRCVRNPLS